MKGLNLFKRAQKISDKLYDTKVSLDNESKINLYKSYIELIRKSAYSNLPEAQFELALHYEEINYFGVNKNYSLKKCKYWYEKASNLNHAEACNNLAIILESENEIEKAKKLYKKAIKLGSINAKKNI